MKHSLYEGGEQAKLQEMTYWEHIIRKMEYVCHTGLSLSRLDYRNHMGWRSFSNYYVVFQFPSCTPWPCHSEVKEISVILPLQGVLSGDHPMLMNENCALLELRRSPWQNCSSIFKSGW